MFTDRDSSVGIATRHGLDGLGMEYRCGDGIQVGARFSAPVQTALGPTQPPIQGYRVIAGGKAGRGVTLTPTSYCRG
jgi:hypothetical protein